MTAYLHCITISLLIRYYLTLRVPYYPSFKVLTITTLIVVVDAVTLLN